MAWVLVWGVGKAEERAAGRIRRAAGRVLQRAEPPLAGCPGRPGSQKGKEDMARRAAATCPRAEFLI